jgi:acyl carrier protein
VKAESSYERVKEVLSNPIFLLDSNEITPSADLREDLGLDSIDIAELSMALEDEFGIPEISEDEFERVKTVGDMVKLVEGKKPKAMVAKG